MSTWMWKNAEVSIYTRGTYLMELLLPNTFSFMHDDNRKHKLHSPKVHDHYAPAKPNACPTLIFVAGEHLYL